MTALGKSPFDWTPERIAELRRLKTLGLRDREIAARLGTTVASIANISRSNRGNILRPEIWPSERIEAFKRAWSNRQRNTAEIAAAFGFRNPASATKRAQALGLERNFHKEWTVADDHELTRLWPLRCRAKTGRPGFGIKEIAKLLGTTRMGVHGAAKRLGLPRRFSTWSEWTPERDAELRRLWIEDELSPHQIALRLGCTYRAIINRRLMIDLPPKHGGHLRNRISMAAWNLMSEEDRRALPEFRLPVKRSSTMKRKRSRKLWGTATFGDTSTDRAG